MHLILGFLVDTIDIVFRCPHARHTVLIVSKPLLEMTSQFGQNDSISSLLVNLSAQGLPASLTNGCQRQGILLLGTVKRWKTSAWDESGARNEAPFALAK